MHIKYVPATNQIIAARYAKEMFEEDDQEVPVDIAEIAAWPLDDARDAPKDLPLVEDFLREKAAREAASS